MSLIYQNDPALPKLYHEQACMLACTAALPQIYLWKFLTAAQFLLLGSTLVAERQISADLGLIYQHSPYQVIKKTAEYLNAPNIRGLQVGRIRDGVITFWPSVAEHSFNGVIARVKLSNGVTHFVVYTIEFQPFFNPQPWRTDYVVEEYLLYRVYSKE